MESFSFYDNFWGDKHHGFDVLYQNMKSGIKASAEFLDFLREIYSMEDSCTKLWNKLSKQININSSGSLQPYWLMLKELSDKRSSVHSELCQNVQIIIKSVQKYMDEQQLKQKSNKDSDLQTQNLNNLLVSTGTQLVRAKEVYHARYVEYSKMQKSDHNNANKSRDIERMETKLKKAVDDYKYLIEKYNNTCIKFKSKMVESCRNFQEIETYHLVQMKDFICRFISCLFKADNSVIDQRTDFETKREQLSVETLLEIFVESKSTGKMEPSLVTFEEAPLEQQLHPLLPHQLQTGDFVLKQNNNDHRLLKLNYDASISESSAHSLVAIGNNPVTVDSSFDLSSMTTHISNTAAPAAPNSSKDSTNDLFDQLSNLSDNNSTNLSLTASNDANTVLSISQLPESSGIAGIVEKKVKKYNNIFRRKRNSPSNRSVQKSVQPPDTDNNATCWPKSIQHLVDEEGYSIRPDHDLTLTANKDRNRTNSSFSSSSDDDDDGDEDDDNQFKGIKIEIKPPQENRSDTSSSIPESTSLTKSGTVKFNDNSELINAVKSFKMSSNIFRDHSRRSNTPSTVVENVASQSTSGFCSSASKASNWDLRRKRNSHSQSEIESGLVGPNFQVEFDHSFESPSLAETGMSDSFNSRFDSLRNSKDNISIFEPIDNKSDPWGGGQPHPPPLPEKINVPRAASSVPFIDSKIDFGRVNSVQSTTMTTIPAVPSRLSSHMIEGIPLAIGFTETVNAKFCESFSTFPHDVHTSGLLVISFPCSMIQQFESIGSHQLMKTDPIQFKLTQAGRLRNLEPVNRSIVQKIESQIDDTSYVLHIELFSLLQKLILLRTQSPSQLFFNVDIIRYDVTNSVRSNGNINAPIHISANWQTSDAHTSHLVISYNFQWPNTDVGALTFRPPNAKCGPSEIITRPCGEVRFIVVADGRPEKVQSFPSCMWNNELSKASWRFDLSTNQSGIKCKFILSNGPGSPQPIACQFSAEGSTESGVLLQVSGNRFRISRHKYRLISGRYVWEPLSSTMSSGFCV